MEQQPDLKRLPLRINTGKTQSNRPALPTRIAENLHATHPSWLDHLKGFDREIAAVSKFEAAAKLCAR